MDYVGSANVGLARVWRTIHGGWIFEATTGEAIWFRGMTPIEIMSHRATRGLSGSLI